MVKKILDAKWSGFGMTFEYRTAQRFEYQTNGRRIVFLCTGPVFEWSVYYIGHNPWTDCLNTEPFEMLLQKVWYSNVSGIQMIGIQILTVLASYYF